MHRSRSLHNLGGPSFLPVATTLTIVALVLSLGSPAPAQTGNEVLCNQDIAKAVLALQRAYATDLGRCLRLGNFQECPDPALEVGIQRGESRLSNKLKPGSHCDSAVNVDGVALSRFGPITCPAAWNQCDVSVGSIDTLSDLDDCLRCMNYGIAVHYRRLLDLGRTGSLTPDDRKCLRATVLATGKAFLKSFKEVVKCARGGVKPFACPADDSTGSRFAKALEAIQKKVARCRNEAGVRGEISRNLHKVTRRPILSAADYAGELQTVSRCMACQLANVTFGQDQDCPGFSGMLRCDDGKLAAPGSAFVANEGDGTVTFLTAEEYPLGYLNGTLANSSIAVGSAPVAVAINPVLDTVYVANRDSGTVTFLRAGIGDYLYGSLLASSFAVGTHPSALAFNETYDVLFVVNEGDDSVTLLNAVDGSYLLGTLADSTVAVGNAPSAAAVSADGQIVYVTNYDDGTVTYLDGETGAYWNGTRAASTFPTGAGPSDVAIESGAYWPSADRLAVANELDGTVTLLDPVSGAPWYGSLQDSTFSVGNGPASLSLGFAGSDLYVADRGSGSIVKLGASAGSVQPLDVPVAGPSDLAASEAAVRGCQLYATAAERNEIGLFIDDCTLGSTFPAPGGPHAIAVNDLAGIVYVTRAYNNTVTFFDANTGAYLNGSLDNSTFRVGAWPNDVAVDPVAGILYVVNEHASSVTYLDATTGAYLNGTFANSTFSLGFSWAMNVAFNPSAHLIYVTHWDNTVTYLDSLTGAYLNGSYHNSSFVVGDLPRTVKVNPEAGILYVRNVWDDSITFLDAETGAYLNGTLENSTIALPGDLWDLEINPEDGILYVAMSPPKVAYLDAITGDFLNGAPENSSVDTGRPIVDLTLDRRTGVLYAASAYDNGLVVLLDAATPTYLNGSLADSTFHVATDGYHTAVNSAAGIFYVTDSDPPLRTSGVIKYLHGLTLEEYSPGPSTATSVGRGPSAVAVDTNAGIVYVANRDDDTVTYLDAASRAYLNGSRSASTFAVGDAPEAVAVNPGAGTLYVANSTDGTVTFLDAVTGAYTNGTLANSSFAVGSGPRALAVDPSAGILYVANSADGTVTYLDAATGAYRNGTLQNSSFVVGNDPRALAVDPSAGILYVANFSDGTVTYLDATTGDYVNGTMANSTFAVERWPTAVAVDSGAGLLYVANRRDGTVTYLDAATGAYANGTLADSTFFAGYSPSGIAVDPTEGIVYVTNATRNTVTSLDATTGAGLPVFLTLPTGTLPSAVAVMPPLD